MSETYKILRFFKDENKKTRVIARGLTLEEAKAHCSKESTHHSGSWYKSGWFDGYTREAV